MEMEKLSTPYYWRILIVDKAISCKEGERKLLPSALKAVSGQGRTLLQRTSSTISRWIFWKENTIFKLCCLLQGTALFQELSMMSKHNLLLQFCVVFTVLATIILCKNENLYEKCNVKLEVKIINSKCNITNVPHCTSFRVCQKEFSIIHAGRKTFSSRTVSNDLLLPCCGNCVKYNHIATFKKMSEIPPHVKNTTNFIFPVLGRRGHSKMYGYHFLPVVETPKLFYIAHKRQDLIKELVISCLGMWPLMVICGLMVIISGFICWLMETRGNKKEFPRGFLVGWFEGIWWSFISMTTVGYGDKIPKSIAARLFSIIWIFAGITTFSLVTAMLTSEIYKANSVPPPHKRMQDAHVGVIRDHTYERFLISKHGGIVIEVDKENVIDGVKKLNSLLHHSKIDGYVLDRYEMLTFFDRYGNDLMYTKDIDYIRSHTVITEIGHIDELAYGVLVRDEEDYQFLRDFLLSNRDVINSCSSLFLNSYSHRVQVKQYQREASMFSVEGALFLPSLVVCAVLTLIFLSYGAVYELRTKRGSDTTESNQVQVPKEIQKMPKMFLQIRYQKKNISLCTKKEESLVPAVAGSSLDNV